MGKFSGIGVFVLVIFACFTYVSRNMEDRVRNTPVLSNTGIEIVGHILVASEDYIFQKSVGVDSAVNVWFGRFTQVDRFGVAATFEVVDSILVPSVLIITDKSSMRVGRKSRLSCAAETEEKSNVSLSSDIRRTMHWELRRVCQWQPVVHQGENALLVFSTIPSSEDDSLALFDIENDGRLGIEIVAFPICIDLRAAVDNGEIGLEIFQFLLRVRADEHVRNKMLLPCHFMDETDLLA